jgi:hypothetical protein
MASYLPPTEKLAIFDPSVFRNAGEEGLTYDTASKYFLKYPAAQGTEDLLTTNVNGTLTTNAGVVFNVIPTSTAVQPASNDSSTKVPTTAWVQSAISGGTILASNNTWTGTNQFNNNVLLGDGTGNTLTMDQTGIDTTIANNQTDGTIFLQSKNGSGTMIDTLSINSGSNGIVVGSNVKLDMNSQLIDQIGSAVFVADGTTQTSAYTGAGALTGSYTNTNMTIDADGKITAIANGTAPSTPALSAVLVAGNSAGSTAINMNNNAISAVSSLGFATTSQTSAYTGGTPGSYTNTNMTIDANGKISAISNGSAGSSPFVPIFRNMCEVSTSNYVGGTRISFGGSWGIQDYAMFRITAQANWGNSSGAWTSYSTTAGLLIARPYYMSSNAWATTLGAGSGSIATYPSNSGGVNAFGATQRPAYYTAIQNNGTTNFFYLYSNSSYQFQLMCNNANGLNVFTAWEYSHSIEYISRSVGGGSVSFQSVDGTNNYL